MDLNTLVKNARVNGLEAAAELEEAQARVDEARKEVMEIQKRLRAGETTGDRLHDLAILRHGSLNPALAEPYRLIEEELAAHLCEPVLTVSRWEQQEGCTGLGGRGYRVFSEVLAVGVITRPELVLESTDRGITALWHSLKLPTDRYAVSGGRGSRGEIAVHEGGIGEFGHTSFDDRGQPFVGESSLMNLHFKHLGLPYDKVELAFGVEAVEEWFTVRGEQGPGTDVMRALFAALDYSRDRLPLG